jgi:acetoin utilization protein AcuB
MLVRHRMSAPPITIAPEVPVMDALQLMKEKNVRRLPVVDSKGRLVGIVSEKDLLRAAPSPATALSIFEITYLLHKLTVGEVMTRGVVTVTADTPLERAARIMAERHLGGLPVMDGQQLVGIITETDILLGFSEALGAFEPGVRLTLEAPNRPGILATVVSKIHSLGGNIASLTVMHGREPKSGYIVVKVQGVRAGELADLLNNGTVSVVHVLEMAAQDLA